MLLPRLFPVFIGPAIFSAVVLSGCVIVAGSGGGSNGSDSSGVGGSGGGGFGGEDGAATTVTSSSSGTGGACVGSDGLGVVADCEELNIAPAQGATKQCGPNKDELPPGYNLCVRGYTLFTTGTADELQECLAQIGVQNECDIEPVTVCVDQIFADACDTQEIADNCKGIAAQCPAGEAFNVAQCTDQLRPFSNAGLQELINCFNDTDPNQVTCQQAYDGCYDQVFTF
jgi:hypothetical protein